MEKNIIAIVIFGFTYLLIAARRFSLLHIGRPAGALLGATMMVFFGVLTVDGAYRSIDLNTLVLLFGMMVISEYLRLAGFFKGVAALFIKNLSSPRKFLTAVVWISGIGSAFLVNDTVCIMMTPIILSYAISSEVDALPFLIALATSSNIGSIGTLTGNPQNMLIGSYGHLSYSNYFAVVFPLALLLLYLNNILLKKVFKERLISDKGTTPNIPDFRIKKNLMIKSGFVLFAVVLLWFLGFHLSFTALCGAAFLILIVRISPQRIFSKIDLSILLFFAGLFVVIGAMEETRVFDYFAPYVPEQLTFKGGVFFSFITVIFCNFFSNVPFVMVAMKWVSKTASSEYFYYLLAVISTLAGNLTLIGSMANLIVAEMAKGTRVVGFREYFRYGLLITFVSCLISVCYLFVVFKFILNR